MIKIAGVQFGTLTGGPSSINLSELGDVSITSPLTGNYLRYNSGISEWQNSYLISSDITTALTYTPVNKSGDTMTGNLVMSADMTITAPTPAGGFTSNNAVNKAYVDSVASSGSAVGSTIYLANYFGGF